MPQADHKVFRLGDAVNLQVPQIFEIVESRGYKVGVVSAMNSTNKLSDPAYFFPDPWTNTPPDASWWSRSLTSSIRQLVNDNSRGRMTVKSLAILILGSLRFVRPRDLIAIARYAYESRTGSWKKAIVLDLFLHSLHLNMLSKKDPSFSTIFFNAGAHIQHHYLLYSGHLNAVFGAALKSSDSDHNGVGKQDPFEDVIVAYDGILADYLDNDESEVIIATGLTQVPYNNHTYYYRLNDHADFLSSLSLRFKTVEPRMSRDFSISFEDADDMLMATEVLNNARVVGSGEPVFEASMNGERQLFVTLIYPHEVTEDTIFCSGDNCFGLWGKVSLVAVKNGMHSGKGFLYMSNGLTHAKVGQAMPVWDIFQTINSHFRYPNVSS